MHGRKLGEDILQFGHEGVLYRQSFIMYDKDSRSLWIHTTGVCVKGKRKGAVLPQLPSTVTTWKAWRTLHPTTTVLPGQRARGHMGRFNLKADPARYGLSVGPGTSPILFPFPALIRARVQMDTLDGTRVAVFHDPETGTARAFNAGERTFVWKDDAIRDAGGAAWHPLTGARVQGDARLDPLPATPFLIARWRGFHPRGRIHGTND